MPNDCYLRLKPHSWIQTIANYGNIAIKGQRLIVNAKLEPEQDLILSTGGSLYGLNFNVLILDSNPAEITKKPLERGFGLLIHYPRQGAHAEFEAQDAFIGGWFCIEPKMYGELWKQIRQGDYAECNMSLEAGPFGSNGPEWVWEVDKQRALFITGYTIDFTRKVPMEPTVEEKPKRRSLFGN